MDPTTDDQADLRIQLGIALLGTIASAVRAIRARVVDPDTLILIAYFERVPWSYEVESLQDAAWEASLSVLQRRLRAEVRVVVTGRAVFGIGGLDAFEASEFGQATFSFWAYARYGETPGDEDDALVATTLPEGSYTRLP
jgi:hypothetical protein